MAFKFSWQKIESVGPLTELNWFIICSNHQSSDRLIDWLIYLLYLLFDRSFVRSFDWLIDWLIDWFNVLKSLVTVTGFFSSFLSGQMFLDLEKVVTQLESWQDGKAAIIYGAENAFCSGGDLDFVSQQINTDELGRQMSLFMSDTTDRLARLPFVTVAMVRGPAQGGGAELTTACDYRVFTRSADVRFVQAKLGITTGFGGASRLARIIGPTRALQILCSTASINVSNARMLRFCELICKDGEGKYVLDRLIDWSFVRLIVEWLIDRLIDWLIRKIQMTHFVD